MNIGIDMELIKRFKLPRNHAFLKSVFTKNELEYAFSRSSPQTHLCGFFCAKEAVRKVKKGKVVLMKQIEIAHKKNGEPIARLKQGRNQTSYKISISHAGEYAVSCAIG